MLKGVNTPVNSLKAEVLRLREAVFWCEMVVARGTPLFKERGVLMPLKHAAYLGRRNETLPKLFVPDLLRERTQGLRRPDERCA